MHCSATRSFCLLLLALPRVCPAQEMDRVKLSPAALQTARIIGVEAPIGRLSALTTAREPGTTILSLEELSLHQQITEAVVATSFDVDSVLDQIDYERAQIVELQSILLARRQRALGSTSLATLALSTGLGAVSGVLQFSETTKSVGNGIGFAAGGLSTLLSFHSLRQQRSGARPAWSLPSMLAPLFSEAQDNRVYPRSTWDYLSGTREGTTAPESRRERLLAEWRKAGRFPALDSPKFKSRMALLTGSNAGDKKLNLDLLSERAAMLADLHDEVAVMKRILNEILRGIAVRR